jgi:uncharacterized membrane protein
MTNHVPRSLWRPLVAAGLVALLAPAVAAAKSYDHPLIEQVFRLQANGDALVEDVRTFRFDGAFSWADLRIKGTGQYGDYSVEYLGVEDADSGEALTYETSFEDGANVLKWHYTAADTTRRFLLRYRISGAVQRYTDAAQFYWKAIEDQHASIDRVHITIIPPAPSPELFKVFVHSDAAPGELTFAPDFAQAEVTQSGIPDSSFVEVRALLDPALFPQVTTQSAETNASLLEDEKVQAASTLRSGWLWWGRVALAALLNLGLLGAYLWAYVRFGREPKLDYQGIYEREAPTPLPPAVVPAILTQGSPSSKQVVRGFVATLLEAGRLGYLKMTERMSEGMLGTGLFKHTELLMELTPKGEALLAGGPVEQRRGERSLESFETAVLRLAFQEAGDGHAVTSAALKNWSAEMEGQKSRFLIFVEQWGQDLRSWFERSHFELDDPRGQRAQAAFVVGGVLLGMLAVAVAPGASRFAFIAIPAIVVILSIIGLSRRTPEAALEVKRWDNFRRFMTDFSAMKEAGPALLPLWETYLVYATALGVADKLLKNVQLVSNELGQPLMAPMWYGSTIGAHGDAGAMAATTVLPTESLVQSLGNLTALQSALTTATSTGGGFSGGGGGGGGGGSSGAG